MKSIFATAIAGAIAITAVASAQAPAQQAPASPAQAQAPAASPTATPSAVTVEGCLMREKDVAGLKPNVVERAGVTEDYVLTASKVVKGAAASSAAAAKPDATAVGTSGTAVTMYDVKGISEDTLKQHIGRRVQIDGRFDDLDRAASSATAKDGDDLVEIHGSAIRPVAGECGK